MYIPRYVWGGPAQKIRRHSHAHERGGAPGSPSPCAGTTGSTDTAISSSCSPSIGTGVATSRFWSPPGGLRDGQDASPEPVGLTQRVLLTMTGHCPTCRREVSPRAPSIPRCRMRSSSSSARIDGYRGRNASAFRLVDVAGLPSSQLEVAYAARIAKASNGFARPWRNSWSGQSGRSEL